MYDSEDVIRKCRNGDVEFLRLVYVGNDGVLRGKVANAADAESLLEAGINVSKTTQSFTSSGGDRFANGGEARLVPDPATFRVLPYAERTAVMLCELRQPSGNVWDADPRTRLREFLADAVPSRYDIEVAFESEFSLVQDTDDGLEPFDRSLGYSVYNMEETHGFVTELVDVLESLGMVFESYVPEYGEAQQEVVEHAPTLRAVDNYVLFKQAVRTVAGHQDALATFLPKPFEKAGNVCHFHVSVWDDDENLFYDGDSDAQFGLSEKAEYFIGGILAHADALAALTTPTVMSYDRLKPGKWASAYACWGYDNREAAVRIPSQRKGRAASTTRLEYKPADNTMNPCLSLLGLIAAGMDGVENEITPQAPVSKNPHVLFEQGGQTDRVSRLPTSLRSALEALEDDAVLLDALGDDLAESYLKVKYDECDVLEDGSWELEEMIRAF